MVLPRWIAEPEHKRTELNMLAVVLLFLNDTTASFHGACYLHLFASFFPCFAVCVAMSQSSVTLFPTSVMPLCGLQGESEILLRSGKK